MRCKEPVYGRTAVDQLIDELPAVPRGAGRLATAVHQLLHHHRIHATAYLDTCTKHINNQDKKASNPVMYVFGYSAKKIYRLKEDQAFSLSLELGSERKSCAASVCRFPPSLRRRGW